MLSNLYVLSESNIYWEYIMQCLKKKLFNTVIDDCRLCSVAIARVDNFFRKLTTLGTWHSITTWILHPIKNGLHARNSHFIPQYDDDIHYHFKTLNLFPRKGSTFWKVTSFTINWILFEKSWKFYFKKYIFKT